MWKHTNYGRNIMGYMNESFDISTKFAEFSGYCTTCNKVIKRDDRIFCTKDRWCIDIDCVCPRYTPAHGTPIELDEAKNLIIPERIQEKHKAVWDFALDEAAHIFYHHC